MQSFANHKQTTSGSQNHNTNHQKHVTSRKHVRAEVVLKGLPNALRMSRGTPQQLGEGVPNSFLGRVSPTHSWGGGPQNFTGEGVLTWRLVGEGVPRGA